MKENVFEKEEILMVGILKKIKVFIFYGRIKIKKHKRLAFGSRNGEIRIN